MRKQLLLAVARRLRQQVPELAYIDIWNENLANIRSEAVWPTPSVFIEFEPYKVKQLAGHVYQADVPVLLHIVTRAELAKGIEDNRFEKMLDYFDLIDRVHLAMATLSGDTFATPMLTASTTNHNHAELIKSLERYVISSREGCACRFASDKLVAGGLTADISVR